MCDEDQQQRVKNRLDEELAHLHFHGEEQVLKRTHPVSWQDRIRAIWNKELELPLLPTGAVVGIVLLGFLLLQQTNFIERENDKVAHRQLVEVAGNTYWLDDFEKVVARYETPDQG